MTGPWDGHGVGPSPELVKAAADHLEVERGGITFPAPTMVPYPNSGSGYAAGSDTSRERQERNDASGVTSAVQQLALRTITSAASEGVTVAEFEDMHHIGHGQASSAFSHLHRAGHVRRIKMRRKRHEIYVLPEHINGREESPYRPRMKPAKHISEVSDEVMVEAMVKADIPVEAHRKIRAFLKHLP